MESIDFWSAYVVLEPEEACTLGDDREPGRLRPMGLDAEERRLRLFREAAAASAVPRPGETREERLDRLTLRRHALLELRLREDGANLSEPDWALYPYAMLRYEAARRGRAAPHADAAGDADRARLSGLGSFLAGHRELLEEGRARGRIAHRSLLARIVEHELVAARRWIAGLDEEAAAALEEHRAYLRDELLPQAPEQALLGAEEYAEGLRLTYGMEGTLDDLVAEARDALAETQAALLATAREVAPDRSLPDLGALREFLLELQRETLPPGTDVARHHRTILARALAHMESAGEFRGVALDRLGLSEYPEGLRDRGPGTNWPAPLLDPEGRAQFVLHPDPAAHSRAWSAILAVHEGIPGHGLQSLGYQDAFRGHPAPLRFLCVADDVAIPRRNFVSMLAVEGWAVYAEERVRLAGFHRGPDRLFALASRALRAVRVVAEIELHRGGFTAEQTAAFVEEQAALPSGAGEVHRYERAPFQALSYFLGARELDALRRRVEDLSGNAFSATAFHDRLLSLGPVHPADAAAVFETPTRS